MFDVVILGLELAAVAVAASLVAYAIVKLDARPCWLAACWRLRLGWPPVA